MSQFRSDCWCSLRSWVCGPIVSHCPFYLMLPLSVSWSDLLLTFLLLGGISVLYGVSCSFFFLLYWGSNWGTCLKFSSRIGVSIGCLLRLFVNVLHSRFLLLSLKKLLKNVLFWLLPSNIKSLWTMSLRKYVQADADLGDTIAYSKLHYSQEYFNIYAYFLIFSYLPITSLVTGLPHPHHVLLQYND